MADGNHPPASPRLTPPPQVLRERQRLSRELVGWEHELIRATRGGASSIEIEQTLDALTETGAEIVKLVRAFEGRFTGSIAASPRFSINTRFLADLLADTLSDGLTLDAARVLVAAVKRECA